MPDKHNHSKEIEQIPMVKGVGSDIIAKNESETSLQEMNNAMNLLLDSFSIDSDKFNPETAFKKLLDYMKKYDRVLYHTITVYVYTKIYAEGNGEKAAERDTVGTMLSNIEHLYSYTEVDSNIANHKSASQSEDEKKRVDDAKKTVIKIYDHINLARRQFNELKLSDEEYDEKFQKRITSFQNRLTSDMSAQLLSMVGIFTALSFILFGGINSLQVVFDTLKETDIIKLMMLACVWGLGMLNVVFVFLFCIGKMTKLNFKSSLEADANFMQKYPVVCWTDFLMLFILISLMWFDFCKRKGIVAWLSQIIVSHPEIASLSGSIVIIMIFVFAFFILHKFSKSKPGGEDE